MWTEWSNCEGNCGADSGIKTRKKKCLVKRANCEDVGGQLFVVDKIACTKPCDGNFEFFI